MAFSKVLLILSTFLRMVTIAIAKQKFQASQWSLAHATFYGDESASATVGGACGYGNPFSNGYGTNTAALSSTLLNDGYGCGTCYQIRCTGSTACYGGSPIIAVTATNLCPPNWAQDSNNGGWCNPPRAHSDMSKPAFMKIAEWRAGIIPGNAYWLLVYVMNVGGGGDVGSVWVKGSNTGWISMTHNWGVSYQAFTALAGQSLSFKITSYATRDTVVAWHVAPPDWSVGLTYDASVNFY
ncbi:putative expansin-A30 [Ananas comosus]|uniref:Expansin n=1 Tax=Ananas comosus TaxID=4615 RepID=A0A199VIJ5_ANACO|nr:putative expansin-A30 [Ananas comosus]